MSDSPTLEQFENTLQRAKSGDVEAQLNIANYYLEGLGTVQNSEQAVYWYQQAAQAGSAHGQYMLSYRYKYGDGVEENLPQALYWFEQSLINEPENPYSAFAIGSAYDELVVIVAGYKPEMQEFLKSNPGLASRFTNHIEFHDYDLAELEKANWPDHGLTNLEQAAETVNDPELTNAIRDLLTSCYRDSSTAMARQILLGNLGTRNEGKEEFPSLYSSL